MSRTFCYDIYTSRVNDYNKTFDRFNEFGIKEKGGQYGPYFHTEITGRIKNKKIHSRLLRYGYKFRKYEKRWERSSNYRDTYFSHHFAPYHCAYCGRSLKRSLIEVDHLVPVAKAKSSKFARLLLFIFAIYTVNDPRNLVSACHKCNSKKSDKMGFWTIRGFFGQSRLFWIVYRTVSIALLLFLIYLGIMSFDSIKNIISTFNLADFLKTLFPSL